MEGAAPGSKVFVISTSPVGTDGALVAVENVLNGVAQGPTAALLAAHVQWSA